jgi:predicted O-methyltransferase YrrM
LLESELTPPSAHCPSPHLWHAHDGMATEVEVLELVGAFVRALQPEVVVETGTHRGFGAEAIGRALEANGHGHLFTLEIDEGLHAEAFERTRGLPVTCLLLSSADFIPPAPIDFAWFDSETNLRVAEYHQFRPFMHDRSLVGFHDTSPHHGYRPQLDALGISLLDLPTPRGVTFGRIR